MRPNGAFFTMAGQQQNVQVIDVGANLLTWQFRVENEASDRVEPLHESKDEGGLVLVWRSCCSASPP